MYDQLSIFQPYYTRYHCFYASFDRKSETMKHYFIASEHQRRSLRCTGSFWKCLMPVIGVVSSRVLYPSQPGNTQNDYFVPSAALIIMCLENIFSLLVSSAFSLLLQLMWESSSHLVWALLLWCSLSDKWLKQNMTMSSLGPWNTPLKILILHYLCMVCGSDSHVACRGEFACTL